MTVFLWTFRKFLQRIKETFWNFLESSQKKTPMAKSYFSKVAGFYKSKHRRCSVKKVFLEKGVRKIHRKTRQSLRPKAKKKASGCKKETPAQVLSCEFCEISNNTSFTEHFRTLLLLAFQKQPPEVFHEKKFSWKFRKIHRKTPVPEYLFLIKLQALSCNFVKKETLAQVFSCEFCEINSSFITRHR